MEEEKSPEISPLFVTADDVLMNAFQTRSVSLLLSHRVSFPCGFALLFFLYKEFIYLLLEKGREEREREGEKHQCVVAPHAPITGNLAHNPGMCPDWELNRQPFGLQGGIQSTEPHQPGAALLCFKGLGRGPLGEAPMAICRGPGASRQVGDCRAGEDARNWFHRVGKLWGPQTGRDQKLWMVPILPGRHLGIVSGARGGGQQKRACLPLPFRPPASGFLCSLPSHGGRSTSAASGRLSLPWPERDQAHLHPI